MIYIEQGEENTIILTLTESATLVLPVFLFKFQWETDVDVAPLYWIGTDLSDYTYRYNQFLLDEGTDVTFRLGQYTYEVYEDVTGSAPATEAGLTMIEEGRMVVNGTASTIYD